MSTENLAYLSLGSNHQPEENLPKALAHLAKIALIVAVSPVYETLPIGEESTSTHYLNAALILKTTLNPVELKAALVEIENQMGRNRTPEKKHIIPIDLDIVLFNDAQLELGKRKIPDPAIYQYAYVTIPLADIAPNYVHPITGETLKSIAARMGNTSINLRSDLVLIEKP